MAGGDSNPQRKRHWIGPLLVGFAIFASTMFTASVFLLSSWTETESATLDDAQQAFAAARGRFATIGPYLAIDDDGSVRVTRELERSQPAELDALHLLSFEPARGRLIDVAFPYWFVRLKISDTMNLGTITSVLARDWRNLDLRVTEDDLEALGPALLLDHELENGARIMLWTE